MISPFKTAKLTKDIPASINFGRGTQFANDMIEFLNKIGKNEIYRMDFDTTKQASVFRKRMKYNLSKMENPAERFCAINQRGSVLYVQRLK